MSWPRMTKAVRKWIVHQYPSAVTRGVQIHGEGCGPGACKSWCLCWCHGRWGSPLREHHPENY